MSARDEFAKLLGNRFYLYLLEKHPKLAEQFKDFKVVMVDEDDESSTNFTN